MSSLENNLERLRRGQEAFARGDVLSQLDAISEDVDWGTTGTFPGTDVSYRGIAGMEEWMRSLLSAWETFRIEVEEVLHDADDVLVVTEHLEARGLESGIEVEMRAYSTYWFEDGKIVRRRAFVDPEGALAAAGAA